uniref:carbonic anhydrase n=2 Tax=Eukaryota TaxID=2759 RepID=A0A7S0DME4_9EUKA
MANPAFPSAERLRQILPDAKGVTYALDSELNITALLPTTQTYYHYMGSLTTPPCSENVAWHVMINPITMSRDQLHALTLAYQDLEDASKFMHSFRPVQPLNGRTIYVGQNPAGLPPAPPASPSPPAAPGPAITTGNVTLQAISTSTYDYTDGPLGLSNWGSLSGSECGTGLQQSPIDIVQLDVLQGANMDLVMNYNPPAIYAENTGKTIKFTTSGAGTLTIGATVYNLLQFHLHYLSEHTFNGGSFPLEIHFVHQDPITLTLAVVGVMIREGARNEAFNDELLLEQILPRTNGIVHKLDNTISNFTALFPTDRTYYHYKGSLTTPPCSEGVQWHVFREPVTMSKKQINIFKKAMTTLKYASKEGFSFRPTQPLNGRSVYYGYPPVGVPSTPSMTPTMAPTILAQAVGTVKIEDSSSGPSYNYKEDKGPSMWHTLSTAWDICKSGLQQSPIDIVESSVFQGANVPIVLSYSPSSVFSINTGKTLKFNIDSGNSMAINGRSFNLLQFHLHSTSEHTFNGGSFPLEIHFVHADSVGNLAVLGVMVTEGAANPAFPNATRLDQYLPDAEGVSNAVSELVDFQSLFPSNRDYYHYMGSLTTPPCSENVAWHVFKNPITMSKEQIHVWLEAMRSLASASKDGLTNRPTLPLNGRKVYLGQSFSGIPVFSPSPSSPAAPLPSISGVLTMDPPSTSTAYDYGAKGPSVWHTLDSAWGVCSFGTKQSPIDIDSATVTPGENVAIDTFYVPTAMDIKNNGKTLVFNGLGANTIVIGGVTYTMVNIHFHHSSEHLFNGGGYPVEIHLVHASASGQLAVLGIMVEEGSANLALPQDMRRFTQIWPGTKDISHKFSLTIDINSLLPNDRTYYHYQGSLTTPPCSENVNWHVFRNPITMSSTQLDTLVASLRGLKDASPLGFSFRPVQPLNGRMVTVGYPRAEPTPGAPVAEATLKFAFDYFSASALAQQAFIADLTAQLSMTLNVSQSAVQITNLQKGSTIVTVAIRASADTVNGIQTKLDAPESLFTSALGWDIATYGAAELSSGADDKFDCENKNGNVEEYALTTLIVLIVVAIVQFLYFCLCFRSKTTEQPYDVEESVAKVEKKGQADKGSVSDFRRSITTFELKEKPGA